MSTFLPFNQNPTSIAIKTSSYSIPATSYAKVTVIDHATDFTIDGVTAIPATVYSAGWSGTTSGTKFTNTSPWPLIGSITNQTNAIAVTVRNSTTATAQVNPYSNAAQTTAVASANIGAYLPVGAYIECASGGAGSGSYQLQAVIEPSQKVFWVPPSTALVGSRYVVELFNIP
jgi:hypothetical protein